MTALLFSFLTFFSTALGGLFALHRRRQLYLVMGLAAGILVAAALLDLLPDALHLAHESGQSSTRRILAAAVIGFLAFWGLDRLMHRAAAGHEHGHEPIAFGAVAALGLTIHSFLDGFAIGSAFQASSSTGFLVAMAVIAHDFGDGVSTVGVVLGSRGKLRHSLGWLLADATAPVVGCAAALVLSISPGGASRSCWASSPAPFFSSAPAHLLPKPSTKAGRGGCTSPSWLASASSSLPGFWEGDVGNATDDESGPTLPPRIKAAFQFLHLARIITEQVDASIPTRGLRPLEKRVEEAALRVLQQYLPGEMDFAEPACPATEPTETAGPTESG